MINQRERITLIHIVGARPQFIKMAAVSRAIGQYNRTHDPIGRIEELIIHTGQHYDYGMSDVFFEELEIPKADYNLGVGSGTHGEQTGEMLRRVEQVLLKENPDIVLVYGDTNSTLAGAIAAAKLHIPVAHVEAGLRSFNRRMPEEINRVLTDHASAILFCPTEAAVQNLRLEGLTNIVNSGYLIPHPLTPHSLPLNPLSINHPVVFNVGDVMYDSVLYNLRLAANRPDILSRLTLSFHQSNELNKPNEQMSYALATVHRAENTDDPERLHSIFQALTKIAESGLSVVVPLHPRTRKQLNILSNSVNFSNPTNSIDSTNLIIIDPVSYLDMLMLEKNADMILTDSGGVQKEAFILRVPCITLREETEWVETVKAGWNVLVGADAKQIWDAVRHFRDQRPADLQTDPYGDGHASERIVEVVSRLGGRR